MLAFLAVIIAVVGGVTKAVLEYRQSGRSFERVIEPTAEPVVVGDGVPGYVLVLYDKNRPEMVKVVGSRNNDPSPLEKIYTIKSRDYKMTLGRVYDELRPHLVVSTWYNKDASAMYFDHLMGEA